MKNHPPLTVTVTASRHSLTGYTVHQYFTNQHQAHTIAAIATLQLPAACRGCAVRQSATPNVWYISIPCTVAAHQPGAAAVITPLAAILPRFTAPLNVAVQLFANGGKAVHCF